MRIRIPVVPGANEADENIRATARFVAEELDPSIAVHLIPYHRFGSGKYELLGTTGRESVAPTMERMAELQSIVATFGLEAVVGG
jgi:pyruvate formate lyase activating enzyme